MTKGICLSGMISYCIFLSPLWGLLLLVILSIIIIPLRGSAHQNINKPFLSYFLSFTFTACLYYCLKIIYKG